MTKSALHLSEQGKMIDHTRQEDNRHLFILLRIYMLNHKNESMSTKYIVIFNACYSLFLFFVFLKIIKKKELWCCHSDTLPLDFVCVCALNWTRPKLCYRARQSCYSTVALKQWSTNCIVGLDNISKSKFRLTLNKSHDEQFCLHLQITTTLVFKWPLLLVEIGHW